MLVSDLKFLTPCQKQALIQKLIPSSENKSIELIEAHEHTIDHCPHCQSKKTQKWGKANGLQRHRCKMCKKTFNGLTDTALSKIQLRDKLLAYAESLEKGLSIRESARICQIDPKTAFRWRHKFLSMFAENEPTPMTGIMEADETFFSENSKGSRHIKHRKPRKRGVSTKKRRGERVPVLIVRDRSGTAADFVFPQIEKATVHRCLKSVLSEDVVLCSDGNRIYETFAKKSKILHKRVIGLRNERVVEKIFHIQNLNAYISRLKGWLNPFHGVATKYLKNYLGWRRMLEMKSDQITPAFYVQSALRHFHQQAMPT